MGCILCRSCLVCVSRVDIEIKKNIFNCAFFLSFDILPICGGGSRVSVTVLFTTPLLLNVFSLCVCDLCMLCLDDTGWPKISLGINKVSIHPSKIKLRALL